MESLCFMITSLRETPCFNTCNNLIYDTTILSTVINKVQQRLGPTIKIYK